jgi:SagB-type dehydrogenase family enzyme
MPTIKTASRYHRFTEYARDKLTGHYLDWHNQPRVYKEYPGIEPILLPRDIKPSHERLSQILKGSEKDTATHGIDIEELSLIFRLTYSFTAKSRQSGVDFYYRSVASAGALYPTEMYLATRGVDGLRDGLYHFSIYHHGLSLLREGIFTAQAMTFFLSAIFFRSSWKYRERSYRYHLLDTGHVAENLILTLKARNLPFSHSYDFDDAKINHLLGFDVAKEVALAVIHVPGAEPISDETGEAIDELPADLRNASRVADKERDYPALRDIHMAGRSVIAQAGSDLEIMNELGVLPDTFTRIEPPQSWPESMSFAEAVTNRRSRRNFVKEAISQDCFMALLDALCVESSKDMIKGSPYDQTICIGFLLGNAEEANPGLYVLDRVGKSIGLIRGGLFMDAMADICLDQEWLANAAIHFLFLTNLEVLDREHGTRGYRYAMMLAGRMGERLYLTATAMEFGCCGIGAFYDGEATELLGLNDASRLLYLVAVGPVKRA